MIRRFKRLKWYLHLFIPMKTQVFITSILVLLFSGCYCFKEIVGRGEVRNLNTKWLFPVCCDTRASDVNPSLVSVYHGNITPSWIHTSQVNNIYYAGEWGIRAERFVAPFKRLPFRILGAGLEYNIGRIWGNVEQPFQEKRMVDVYHHRIMLSANLLWLVQPKFFGYVGVRGGVQLNRAASVYNIPDSQVAYRVATGIHYYPHYKTGILFETGYGTGAQLHLGVCRWF